MQVIYRPWTELPLPEQRLSSSWLPSELLSLLLSVQILRTESWAPLAGACDLSALL